VGKISWGLILGTLLWSVSCGGPGTRSLPSPITHGDWVSSGGEQFKDANNPWWVKNTKHVKYCIAVDETSISATKEKIHAMVKNALGFWQTEFARTNVLMGDPSGFLTMARDAGVGTQTTELVDCSGEEDLRIQLGYGTLDENQKAYLRDPLHYIAIAVRTHYDPVALKGKGFIFVGSDKGPNRFGADTQMEEVWKYDMALWMALAHELGHVFGLPHIGSSRYALMGADLLELFTSQKLASLLQVAQFKNPEGYFLPKQNWKGCYGDLHEVQKPFFGLEEKDSCMSFSLNEKSREVQISAYNLVDHAEHLVAKLDAIQMNVTLWPLAGIMIMLNPKQEVFTPSFDGEELWMRMGPFIANGQGGARVTLVSGESKPVHLEMGPELFQISGLIDGVDKIIVQMR